MEFVIVLLATTALLAAPHLAGASTCDGAFASQDDAGATAQARTVRCLLNAERARHDLPALQANAKLTVAAMRHSRAMVRSDVFDHNGPDSTPEQRVRRAGYRYSSLGETIAWGTGSYGTPAGTVRRWMASPPHRRIILTAGLRDVGVGVSFGAPVPGQHGGSTVTADFGTQR